MSSRGAKRSKPSVEIFRDGDEDLIHRKDGPAVIIPSGCIFDPRLDHVGLIFGPAKVWYEEGWIHRADGPAIVGGSIHRRDERLIEAWLQHDQYHRTDGPALTYKDGHQEWCLDGKAHREDGPALIAPDGGLAWYQYGALHREDGPASVMSDGTLAWYIHDEKHREDGPAVELPDGQLEWYREDELHREDGPAMIRPDGAKEWYQDGVPHREDGPACVDAAGKKEWWIKGHLHREDGPAVIVPDGATYDSTKEWGKFDYGFGVVEGPAEIWFRHGEVQRKGGPAVRRGNGVEEWLDRGFHHRDDGPAVVVPEGATFTIRDGSSTFNALRTKVVGPGEVWFRDGFLHRADGPAISMPGREQYWYDGQKLPKWAWEIHRDAEGEPIIPRALCSGLTAFRSEDDGSMRDTTAIINGHRMTTYRYRRISKERFSSKMVNDENLFFHGGWHVCHEDDQAITHRLDSDELLLERTLAGFKPIADLSGPGISSWLGAATTVKQVQHHLETLETWAGKAEQAGLATEIYETDHPNFPAGLAIAHPGKVSDLFDIEALIADYKAYFADADEQIAELIADELTRAGDRNLEDFIAPGPGHWNSPSQFACVTGLVLGYPVWSSVALERAGFYLPGGLFDGVSRRSLMAEDA